MVSSLIKKWGYWPRHVQGDVIKRKFKNKDVGDVDALQGTFNGVRITIYVQKKSDCLMMIMLSHQILEEVEDHKIYQVYKEHRESKTKEFNYRKPLLTHFRYRHAIYDSTHLYPMK